MPNLRQTHEQDSNHSTEKENHTTNCIPSLPIILCQKRAAGNHLTGGFLKLTNMISFMLHISGVHNIRGTRGQTISTYDNHEASTHTSTGRGPQIRYNVGYKIVTTYVAEKEDKEKKRNEAKI